MFVVIAKLKVKPDLREPFVELLTNHVRLSRAEGRCLTFDVCNSTESDLEFLYYEDYPSEALFDDHINSKRVQEHLHRSAEMLDGDVWFAKWNRISDGW